jgi:tetrahydromethanopterin S-methyltransferase subunit H
LWRYSKAQTAFQIGKTSIGGVPGERPTVLIGSIFYHKHRILRDERSGEFDVQAAKDLIALQENFSQKTGNPHMFDVVGATPEALMKAVSFMADSTDAPILIDGISPEVRLAGLKRAVEIGLVDRAVYNSFTPETREDELRKVADLGAKSAVLLTLNQRDFSSKGRTKVTAELLAKAEAANITMPLIDTCVIDVPSFGMACEALMELKDKTGLPVGMGAHNAIGTWRGLRVKMGDQAYRPAMASCAAAAAMIGADFILYGPVQHADVVFPAVAMVDAAHAQLLLQAGKVPPRTHPIFRIA